MREDGGVGFSCGLVVFLFFFFGEVLLVSGSIK